MKFISWNPASSNQYARYLFNQQLDLVEIIEQNEIRKAIVIDSIPEKSISCFEWQYSSTSPLLAYGTSLGNVHLVDWKNHKEVRSCFVINSTNIHILYFLGKYLLLELEATLYIHIMELLQSW